MEKIQFLNLLGKFKINNPENYNFLYFPIASNNGIKSSVTPNFGGDAKYDQNSFVLEPVSVLNLNNNRGVRNFWLNIKDKGVYSCVGASSKQEYERFTSKQDESNLVASFMNQTLTRKNIEYGITSKVTIFAPISAPIEVMYIEIINDNEEEIEFTPIASIPLFARSADNIRDHRHVTSLLHRIKTIDNGVLVKPTLSFDERGHKKNNLTYFTLGVEDNSNNPIEFFPVLEDFILDGGSLTNPRSVILNLKGVSANEEFEGKEAHGGIKFNTVKLKKNEKKGFTILIGMCENVSNIDIYINQFNSKEKVFKELEECEAYWNKQVNVSYYTGDTINDNFMKWVSFQPLLRRIYGCSFLPHHDYGRGGRGWRDLWQDCLSLLIMDPSNVKKMIVANYGGVRIDGTNATIIGEKLGEFKADRNGIARVWMDHGVWPLITTKLYIDQTGDIDILFEKANYFKDEQACRGYKLDKQWNSNQKTNLKDRNSNDYQGSILEHILLEQLCAFYDVGAHNIIKLRGADWNDALDMASENGESVAFSCAYAKNIEDIANLLTILKNKGVKKISVLKEIETLLEDDLSVYNDISKKREVLEKYNELTLHNVSNELVSLDINYLINNLLNKANWLRKYIIDNEWISSNEENLGWFNSYYDNSFNKVEGYYTSGVRMMLTGQVFSIMSKTASDERIKQICNAVDKYLYKKEAGGYRLNTNFHEEKFDLGRMFGFAYGEKENGAVFSHMCVMYANALYQRGFIKEGYKVLKTLEEASMNFDVSKIYPGIPEYFDAKGQGLYNYLTGAASWYMLTYITEVFGVKGKLGDLLIKPQLVKEQFDSNNKANISLEFAGKKLTISILNTNAKEYGSYQIDRAYIDKKELNANGDSLIILKEEINNLDESNHQIEIILK